MTNSFLKNFKAIAQNWTHGPDTSSHTNCSSRNSSNKEKIFNKNHSPPPCRDYTMYMELEGTVMNKMFGLISVHVFKLH